MAETLETRTLLAADFAMLQNPIDPEDVNDDGIVAPMDALMVINRLNNSGQSNTARGFFDVNGDGQLAPMDALRVINRLNNPSRGGELDHDRTEPLPNGDEVESEYSIDGSGNNVENPEWGSTDEQLLRTTTVEYADGVSEPAGEDRPSAREISNTVVAQTTTEANDRFLTDITWVWGQFIDHDIDLTEGADPAESFNIEVTAGDPFFDPEGTGDQVIAFNRSIYDPETGTSSEDPRAQINQITAFLDGSVVYGSDEERAAELRTFEGGLLKTSEGDLLPFNEAGLENAGGTSSSLFLAGDVRANENAALTAMQTLWVREHNYWAEQIAADDPTLADEEIFQQARSIVIAELQSITYNEYLPALLGYDAVDAYDGYDSTVDPGIANVFSTAAYRFGHTMLSSQLLRLNNDGTTADEGDLSLQNAFFAPDEITENGIDSLLLGVTAQVANEIDNQIVDDVRNFLFGEPGSGGFDLASLNIQRGRDHGLADYNQSRVDYGLAPVEGFSDITSDPELAAKLEALYGDVNNIDVWVGGLAEDHVAGSSLGELFTTIIADQFERIRDGDANWYENVFSGTTLAQLNNTSLSDVIERNTEITGLRENVFFDDAVLYFAANGSEPVEAALVVADGQVNLINQRSGEVIESRNADEVSQVQLVGSDAIGDRFTIDLRASDTALTAGVVVYGGLDLGNSITVLGSDDANSVTVDGNRLTVNGTTIEYSNISLIRWVSGSDDNFDVISEGDAQFVIGNGSRPDTHDLRGREDRPDREDSTQPTEMLAEADRERSSRSAVPPRGQSPTGRLADVDAVFAELGATPPDAFPTLQPDPRGGSRRG